MANANGIKIAKYLCLIPGIFLIVSGILLLFAPAAAASLYGIDDVAKLHDNWALSMGIRQFAIGLMIVVLALANQVKALGIVMVIGAIVPFADFLIFKSSIGWVSALRHAAPVPFILGLGLYLLFQLRKPL